MLINLIVSVSQKTAGAVCSSADWTLDPEELASKFSKKTKALFLNNPNNPLGKVPIWLLCTLLLLRNSVHLLSMSLCLIRPMHVIQIATRHITNSVRHLHYVFCFCQSGVNVTVSDLIVILL